VSYRVRYTDEARDDLRRLYAFLLKRDLGAARRALAAIRQSIKGLEDDFPQLYRRAEQGGPLQRELVIPFGGAGYVALFEIDDAHTVTIVAVRHQLEADYR
jgi:plasmid stabilization system protein ParE